MNAFEILIGAPEFPCVGAKAAMQRDAYRFGFYGAMGEVDAARHCTADLQQFATFIAIFAGPREMSEYRFSERLWRHLSLVARQFPHCALVFNVHSQFERLKSKGTYANIRDTIRDRDVAREGHINPMVEDHGVRSEALQYDGGLHPEGWRPPFSRETTGRGKCPFTGLSGVREK